MFRKLVETLVSERSHLVDLRRLGLKNRIRSKQNNVFCGRPYIAVAMFSVNLIQERHILYPKTCGQTQKKSCHCKTIFRLA